MRRAVAVLAVAVTASLTAAIPVAADDGGGLVVTAAAGTISARPSVPSIRVGRPLTIRGRVTPATLTKTVVVQRVVNGKWSDRASGPVAGDGAFAVPITPNAVGTYTLRVRSAGGSIVSSRFTLVVAPIPTISIAASASSIALSAPVTIAGTVRPANATTSVVSQRLVGGRWVDRDRAIVNPKTGAYGIVIHPADIATYAMRVRSSGGTVHSTSVRFSTFRKANDAVDLGVARPGERVVSLTFDDGPGAYTTQILDVLAKYHVKATFFVLGQYAQRYPDYLKRELRDGHHVASHSWDHPTLTKLSDSAIRTQLGWTQDVIVRAGGAPRCVRPPYGSTDARVEQIISEFRSSATVLWNVDPADWERPGTGAIVSRVMGAIRPGAVILMHDGGGSRGQSVAALDALIPRIQAAGYSIRPIC